MILRASFTQPCNNCTTMARHRKKNRTHVGARNRPSNGVPAATSATSRAPKSMVIRTGAEEVGPSVSQLVKDVRSMMEPGTASRLKVFVSRKCQYWKAEYMLQIGKEV